MSIRKVLFFSIGKALIKDICYLILTTLKMLNYFAHSVFRAFYPIMKKKDIDTFFSFS